MAINCYTGLMGSGKSYEVVSTVIVKALSEGRRVSTNIAGIDNDECRAYVHQKLGVPLDKIGQVVTCPHERVLEPNFFPHKEVEIDGVMVVDDSETFVKAGDMVCIDEAWRFWASGSGAKLSNEHFIFFREHRHYVKRETDVACDLSLMVQDVSDLMAKVKTVIEMTTKTTKMKSLGLHKHYRIEFWEGFALTQSKKSGWRKKTYDKDIFPLYSSYAGAKGKEHVIDDRQNMLKNPMLWIYVCALAVVIPCSVFGVYRFFNPAAKAAPVVAADRAPVSAAQKPPASASSAGALQRADPSDPASSYSAQWRIVGVVKRGSILTVAVKGLADQPLRFIPSSKFVWEGGRPVAGSVDGQMVTDFSGSSAVPSGPSVLRSAR